jgi:hypothetical protein
MYAGFHFLPMLEPKSKSSFILAKSSRLTKRRLKSSGERDPAWLISVPDDLAITHPLVKHAESKLNLNPLPRPQARPVD